MSPTTRDLLLYYCMRADQATGRTNVSVQRTSQDLELRKDHVDEHDRKLLRGGYIEIVKDENGGRIVQLCGAWQSSAERKRKPLQVVKKEDGSQVLGESSQDLGSDSQNSGNSLNSSPSFGDFPQNLGEVTQDLGKTSQNLGESPQNLGAHIRNNQPMNQPMNQPQQQRASASTREAAAPAGGEPFNPVTAEGAGDPLQDRLDRLFRVVQEFYRLDRKHITRSFEAQINEQVGQLNALGATPENLTRFFAQRRKMPGMKFIAEDYQTWAIDLENLSGGVLLPSNGGGNGHRVTDPNLLAAQEAKRRLFGSQDPIDAEVIYDPI